MPVKPHVMVLGPAKDTSRAPWPLQLRLDMAKDLAGRNKSPAVVMESAPDLPDENPARKFARLIRDYNVQTYLVLWPKGCRMNGLDIELGWLLNEIVNGRINARDVVLVVQADHVTLKDEADGEATVSLGETGNRTRYYEALVDEGCTIRKYRTLPDLARNVAATAAEHVQRHIVHADPQDFVGKAAEGWRDQQAKKPKK